MHGLHVHTDPIKDESNNDTIRCGSSGAHFNPMATQKHGDIFNFRQRHVGDFGNVVSDTFGSIVVTFRDDLAKLDNGPNGILGRTLVLHQLQDDLGLQNDELSKTTGNSGNLVLFCLITK